MSESRQQRRARKRAQAKRRPAEPTYPAGPGEPGPGRELRMGMDSAMAVDRAGLTRSPSSEVAAWLDAQGLPYSWVDPNETGEERFRRLFG